MTRGKVQIRKALPWAVRLIGIMGLLGGVPAPVVGQANPPLTAEQSAELEEAKRLHQQAEELYNQGQYAAAIPLVKRALAIQEKVLGKEHPDFAESLNNLAVQLEMLQKPESQHPYYWAAFIPSGDWSAMGL